MVQNLLLYYWYTEGSFASRFAYYTFHKHANSKVQRPPSQLLFSLPSIIITIISNEPWNTETQNGSKPTNHKSKTMTPFEPVKVKFCFLRGPFRWLTAAKNAIVSWLLNFWIRMFVKSAVIYILFIFIYISLLLMKKRACINIGKPVLECGLWCRLSVFSVHYGFRILKMYEILCETKLTLKYVVNKNDLLSFIPFGQLGDKEKNPL